MEMEKCNHDIDDDKILILSILGGIHAYANRTECSRLLRKRWNWFKKELVGWTKDVEEKWPKK